MVWFSVHLDAMHNVNNLMSAVRGYSPIDDMSLIAYDRDEYNDEDQDEDQGEHSTPVLREGELSLLDIGWYSPKKAKMINSIVDICEAPIIALQGMKRVDTRPYVRSILLVYATYIMKKDVAYKDKLECIFHEDLIPELPTTIESDWIKDMMYSVIGGYYPIMEELLYMPRPSIFEIKCAACYQQHSEDATGTMLFMSGIKDNRLVKFLLKSIVPPDTNPLEGDLQVHPRSRTITLGNKSLIKAKNHPTGYFTNIIKPFNCIEDLCKSPYN